MRMRPPAWAPASLALLLFFPPDLSADSTSELIKAVKAVGPRGSGHDAAQKALRELTQSGPEALPAILLSFDDADPLAANWLRGAFEAIAARTLHAGGELPAEAFEEFVLDRNRNPRARRMAFEWLKKVDRTADERIVPGMLHDPSAEMRRDAVARLMKQAAAVDPREDKDQAIELYRKALSGAVHTDQVNELAKALGRLGVKIDLPRHFGFLTRWHIIGPFDHRGGKGFEAAYPPEQEIDLSTTLDGQLGKVTWKPISTGHKYGIVDIAKDVHNYKGSCMYLATEFHSPQARPVELRLGTPNAWKLWVNGEFLFGREEYHRGMKIDQYRVPAEFQKGKNTILLKICQNEQTEDWAQRYQFQLRVCDAAGSAVAQMTNDQ